MDPSGIGAAVALIGSGVGAIAANQRGQKAKGLIGEAYRIAGKRQQIHQADTRQSFGESMVARGLTGGGAAGHDLASGGRASLDHEQELERQDLESRRKMQLQNINAQTNADIVGGVASGMGQAFEAYGAGSAYQALKDTGKAAGGGLPEGVVDKGMIDSPPTDRAGRVYNNAWGGINPVRPLDNWPEDVSHFNVFDMGRAG